MTGSIPPVIGNLTRLTQFALILPDGIMNLLPNLPQEFWSLPNLTVVILPQSMMTSWPTSISPSLRYLYGTMSLCSEVGLRLFFPQ